MVSYDFGVGWPDIEENDLFLMALRSECQVRNMKFIVITEKDLPKIIKEIENGKLHVEFYLDMASNIYDENDLFSRLCYCLKDSGCYIVDDPDDVKSAADKSITHFKLSNARIPTPYTIVIRHWAPSHRLIEEERHKLGSPFIIKPALGYGQKGVKIIHSHRPLKDISDARLFDPGDNFLLQEIIKPVNLNGRPGWFRIYNLFGEIIPCWWHQETHEYWQVTLKETVEYHLLPVIKIAAEIAAIVKIDWFSCEIAISNKDNKFYAIDYMNDQCAIYPKSQYKDGVPDDIIKIIAERLVEKAWRRKIGESTLTYRAIWFPKIKIIDENI
ncbi:MAG: hypothetical protein AMJ43_05420 [Coxiella sp. DG_40]|nr:MAG: hypothetical protein AMJ43_05420 [Coxiella sp. DG_40]